MSLSRIDEIMVWNHVIDVERSITVNNERIMLNLVPSRMWNLAITKAKLKQKGYLVGKWKQYQTELCSKKVAFNKISYFVTGMIPESQYQLVVFDIDVKRELLYFDEIFEFADALKAELNISRPFRVNETGSGGFHLFYLFDSLREVRNDESKTLNAFAKRLSWIKHINIRASGGFVFAPPSQFKGGLQYHTIWANSVHVNDSEKFDRLQFQGAK
jgi:hypothetical protein